MKDEDLFSSFDPQNDAQVSKLEELQKNLPPVERKHLLVQTPDFFEFRAGGYLEAFLTKKSTNPSTWLRSVQFLEHPISRKRYRPVGFDKIRFFCDGCKKEQWRTAVVTADYWIMDCLQCVQFWWKPTGGPAGRRRAFAEGRVLILYEDLLRNFNAYIIRKSNELQKSKGVGGV
jgi:hypothetical protein